MSNNTKKNAIICSAVGIIIVLAVAITVPIIHNSKVSAELPDTQSIIETTTEATKEATTSEPTTVVIETVAEDKIEKTEVLTTKAAESTTKKSSPATTVAAQSKSTPAPAPTVPPTTKAPETTTAAPTTEGKKMWTQAEIDSIVSEVKAYAVSRNLGIDPSLTTNGTGWMNPQHTDWNTRSNLISHLKDEIDWNYDQLISEGITPDGRPCLNVIAKPTTEGQYEIYIVH